MIILGVLIFFARIIDVSLDTLRLKSMIRGKKFIVSLIAFIEIIVYTLGASQAFKYVMHPVVLLFYACGYAAGNYVGMLIDDKLSRDSVYVLVVTNRDEWNLADTLREQGFAVTTAKGYGMNGAEKSQLIIIVKKKRFRELTMLIEEFDSSAYVVSMDVKDMKR
ncbi:hypothetical protein Desaci_2892 [Desulfosporosinus acidiphilus SJ4]|uniref:DUF5698 domain-containing protein n=1 Tax=Desulfosporosinus acidiphilus (strain DSM 22704 / JCM 16185 / SJ4) TaxID=646529 RepID=I4D7N0_DESAJ|nr:DUF5698 domain-containing protein [Desulfosporosinus acidiphilus]AFM41804.1 hypothetical protein Desaci_2892 [Desulfosporosinus acidiphilus SJ4]